ncbi:MAG: PQQ-like beta-propeller repeat protein [Candidatus Hydrogenedentes bacterium]|nr:PQQ-like beta-propeller repeat protein [Candidatus Hydrogenedentota bacterium]
MARKFGSAGRVSKGCVALFAIMLWIASAIADHRTMLAGDAQHTGYVKAKGPRELPQVIWQATTGFDRAIFDMAPVIDVEGNIYSDIGSSWRAPEEGRTGGAISFSATGKERWRNILPKGQYGLSVPAVAGGRVYMGFRDGVVRALDGASGKVAWEHALPATSIIAAPAIDAKHNIYITTLGQGGIFKFDGNTGEVLWNKAFGSGSGASPALSHDEKTVYAGWAEHSTGLYALDAETGAEKWKWAPEGEEVFFDWCSPMIGKDGTIYQQSEKNGRLYAIADEGTRARLKWSYTPGGNINDTPRTTATDGESIYVGSSGTDPQIAALTPDGAAKWTHTIEGRAEMANILVTEDAIYFPIVVPDGGAGWIHALDKKTGKELWRKKMTHDDSDAGGVALGKDGVLYVGTSGTDEHKYEGVLVAMK